MQVVWGTAALPLVNDYRLAAREVRLANRLAVGLHEDRLAGDHRPAGHHGMAIGRLAISRLAERRLAVVDRVTAAVELDSAAGLSRSGDRSQSQTADEQRDAEQVLNAKHGSTP